MLTNVQIRVLVGMIIVIWFAIALFDGEPIPTHLGNAFSYSVTATTFALVLWERWLWACPGFRILASRPDLRGTWRGEIRSDWPDPEARHRKGPIEAYLVVRQTFSRVDVRMFSLESGSVSLSASIITDAGGVQRLCLTYQNEARALLREESPIHYGGALLNICGAPAERLDGFYWTDRGTKGEATFETRVRKVAHDFAGAAAALGRVRSHARATR